MRLSCIFAGIVLAGGAPAAAQTPVASPGHPGWVVASGGCALWDGFPVPNETVTWSGGCRDGRVDGSGVLVWRVGSQVADRYEGEMRDGRLNGRGTETSQDGGRYEGEWADGKQSGQGVYLQADGTRYEGAWADGAPSGRGLIVHPDGSRFEGELAHGRRTGHGVFVRANGDRYEGDWVDDKASGQGVMVWVGGGRYDGGWAGGRPEGRGVFEAGGKRWEGRWVGGKPVGRPPDWVKLGAGPGMVAPDWLRRPSAEEVSRFWPTESRGINGEAVISCAVTARGTLDACDLVSEEPPGHGFGGAALLLAPTFLMRPLTRDGVPVGGSRITIPIRFKTRGGAMPDLPTVEVARSLPWGETPTAAAMTAAFPKSAAGRVPFGHVVLRCHLTTKGTLDRCAAASEDPPYRGFAIAALRLSKDFRTISDWKPPAGAGEIWVDLPFDFRSAGSPGAALEILDPNWLRTPDPKMAGNLFPADAAKAGYKTGAATLACEVAHGGALINCQVVSEDPAGLGFGKAALAIGAAMVMNPWTAQGAPVDGARFRLPVRINLGADRPEAKPAAPN